MFIVCFRGKVLETRLETRLEKMDESFMSLAMSPLGHLVSSSVSLRLKKLIVILSRI